jgi:hypothetical protein
MLHLRRHPWRLLWAGPALTAAIEAWVWFGRHAQLEKLAGGPAAARSSALAAGVAMLVVFTGIAAVAAVAVAVRSRPAEIPYYADAWSGDEDCGVRLLPGYTPPGQDVTS